MKAIKLEYFLDVLSVFQLKKNNLNCNFPVKVTSVSKSHAKRAVTWAAGRTAGARAKPPN